MLHLTTTITVTSSLFSLSPRPHMLSNSSTGARARLTHSPCYCRHLAPVRCTRFPTRRAASSCIVASCSRAPHLLSSAVRVRAVGFDFDLLRLALRWLLGDWGVHSTKRPDPRDIESTTGWAACSKCDSIVTASTNKQTKNDVSVLIGLKH